MIRSWCGGTICRPVIMSTESSEWLVTTMSASRARAREANIVVTNHSLLSVDMMTGRQIVPPHQLLIIDEAHELADRVSSAAQAELTADSVDRAARAARSYLEGED